MESHDLGYIDEDFLQILRGLRDEDHCDGNTDCAASDTVNDARVTDVMTYPFSAEELRIPFEDKDMCTSYPAIVVKREAGVMLSTAVKCEPLSSMSLIPTHTEFSFTDDSRSSLGNNSPLSFDRHKKRLRQDEDAEAKFIAAETERHLKNLNLDPNSKEGKVEKRKIQNRMSAMLHRERKREYIETLEQEVRSRDLTIAQLRHQVAALEKALLNRENINPLPHNAGAECIVSSLPSALYSSTYRDLQCDDEALMGNSLFSNAAAATSSESESEEGSSVSSFCTAPSVISEGNIAGVKTRPVSAGLTIFSIFLFFSFNYFSFFSIGRSDSIISDRNSFSHGRILMESKVELEENGLVTYTNNNNHHLPGVDDFTSTQLQPVSISETSISTGSKHPMAMKSTDVLHHLDSSSSAAILPSFPVHSNANVQSMARISSPNNQGYGRVYTKVPNNISLWQCEETIAQLYPGSSIDTDLYSTEEQQIDGRNRIRTEPILKHSMHGDSAMLTSSLRGSSPKKNGEDGSLPPVSLVGARDLIAANPHV